MYTISIYTLENCHLFDVQCKNDWHAHLVFGILKRCLIHYQIKVWKHLDEHDKSVTREFNQQFRKEESWN